MTGVTSRKGSDADGTSFTDRFHGYLPAYEFIIPWKSPLRHNPSLLL